MSREGSTRRGGAASAAPPSMLVRRRNTVWGWVFLAPAGILFLVLVAWPTASSLYQSFFEKKSLRPKQFVGWDNYVKMFSDPLFWNSVRVTATWAVVVMPAVGILALLLAWALTQKWLPAMGAWRLFYFVPAMTSIVAIAFVWQWMFEPQDGLVNTILRHLGVRETPTWLASPQWALWSVIIVAVWQQIGFAMILYMAGIQAIPKEFYEAAQLDGASSWTVFRKITIPLLNPTIVLVMITLTINALKEFTLPYVMTAHPTAAASPGGPLNSTSTFVIRIYDLAWHQWDMGYGAANAVVLLLVTTLIAAAQYLLTQRKIEY